MQGVSSVLGYDCRTGHIMKQDNLTRPDYLENLCKEIHKFHQRRRFLVPLKCREVMDASFDYIRHHYENLNMSKLATVVPNRSRRRRNRAALLPRRPHRSLVRLHQR